jgi:hypothetical protein
MTYGAITRWALSSAPAREDLLFAATPMPDASYALAFEDGSAGVLTRKSWAAQRPVQAGYALHLGREQARIVRELGWFSGVEPAELVNVLEVVLDYAKARYSEALLAWFMLGLHGAGPS